jgi:hypothetical protein
LLLGDGIAKVGRFLPECQGVHTANLAKEAQQCLDQIVELGPDRLAEFDWTLVPVIELAHTAQQGPET